MMHFTVIPCGDDPVIRFAAQELVRWLRETTTDFTMELGGWEPGRPRAQFEFLVGLVRDAAPGVIFDGVEDEALDDAVYLDAWNGSGVVAGSNPRSVLLAVYRFLWELGFRWVRPGADGVCVPEHVWQVNMLVFVKETASFRHRGICVEGASSLENILELVDWMPKLGYNAYFIQFDDATVFLNRWYSHEGNPLLAPEPISRAQGAAMTEEIVRALRRRGLLFHAVGHGWTTKAMGLVDGGWESSREPENPELLAEIGGRRALFGGVPTNTNLCYSAAAAQQRFVEAVTGYAAAHPEVDYLHVWLADACNNQCECAACRGALPTDLYVRLLNAIDRRLTELGSPMRMVMLAYQELLWPPVRERLENPERFVLMFAPISRSFERSYEELGELPELPEYRRNRITLPVRAEENAAFLRGWQKVFSGDAFDYDYHLGRAHYGDPGYQRIASILCRDIRCLRGLGLNGMMLCQEQRAGFPTWMPNYAGGLTLWDASRGFEELTRDYFSHAFGEGWEACLAWCELASASFPMDFWNGKEGLDRGAIADRLTRFLEREGELAARLPAPEGCGEPARTSRRVLLCAVRTARLLALALRARALGEDGAADGFWSELVAYIRREETELQPFLDVYRIQEVGRNYAGLRELPGEGG